MYIVHQLYNFYFSDTWCFHLFNNFLTKVIIIIINVIVTVMTIAIDTATATATDPFLPEPFLHEEFKDRYT